MRFVSHRRLFLLAATVLFPVLGFAGARPGDAQYIYGSVKTIPADTAGSLDLTDSSDLRFHYDKVDYELPYSQIKNFQFTQSKPPSHKLGQLSIPKLPFNHREKVLDISFRDDKGAIGTLSFRLARSHVASMEWLLSQRIEALKQEAQATERAKLPESWWGDKTWKTTRNKASWPDPEAVATGTK